MKNISIPLYQNLRIIFFKDLNSQYILYQKDNKINIKTFPSFLQLDKNNISNKEITLFSKSVIKPSTLESIYNYEGIKLIKYFAKLIKIRGVGFRSRPALNKQDLFLKFGTRSAEVLYKVIWKNIKVLSIKKNRIVVYGHDLVLVNEYARKIKELKEVNIYTGKGFRFRNEKVRKKVGKEKRL
jgi:ribosomal protein L6P/L9E